MGTEAVKTTAPSKKTMISVEWRANIEQQTAQLSLVGGEPAFGGQRLDSSTLRHLKARAVGRR